MNCLHCGNCTLEALKCVNIIVNGCIFQREIANLSDEELLKRIQTGKCKWYHPGQPTEVKNGGMKNGFR